MTCPDCSRASTYNLSCLQCAGRYLSRVIRSNRTSEADRLCQRYGHDRDALLEAYRGYRR